MQKLTKISDSLIFAEAFIVLHFFLNFCIFFLIYIRSYGILHLPSLRAPSALYCLGTYFRLRAKKGGQWGIEDGWLYNGGSAIPASLSRVESTG